MRDDSVIEIGDKIDLVKDAGRFYKTMIEDIYDGGAYMVGVPTRGGTPMPIEIGDEVLLVFYRDSGRYIAPMSVAEFEQVGEVRYTLLFKKAEPYRDQRREAYRLAARFRVPAFEYADGIEDDLQSYADLTEAAALETAGSRDISVSGIALTTNKEYSSGGKYLLNLQFEGPRSTSPKFYICARVVRSIRGLERDKYYTGMRFFGQTRSMNEILSRYVFTEQQKQIRKKRIAER